MVLSPYRLRRRSGFAVGDLLRCIRPHRVGTMNIFVAAAFVCLVLLLSIVIWSIRRHRDPRLHIECSLSIDEMIPSLAGLTLGTAVPGNSVEVLENGAFFDLLLERIRSAQKSVHLETFLWADGVLGRRLADALSERARAGKQVRVLLDAEGSKDVGEAAVRQMERSEERRVGKGCRAGWWECVLISTAMF